LIGISYGSEEGSVYLDMKSSPEAQRIFNKFVDALVNEDEWSEVIDNDELYARIKSALVDYNAVYKFNQAKAGHIKRHFIRFGTPKDLTAFLMRYS